MRAMMPPAVLAVPPAGLPPYYQGTGPRSRRKTPDGLVVFFFFLEGEFGANSASLPAEPGTQARAVGTPEHCLHLEMVRPVPLNGNNLCYRTSKIIINEIDSYWGMSDGHGCSGAAAEASFFPLWGQAPSFYRSHYEK